MTQRHKIPPAIRDLVRQRAGGKCEYCHALERWQYVPFTVDHVIPLAKGGSDDPENLALACFHCNRRKADRLTTWDQDAKKQVPLFNPRQDEWSEHFVWSADGLQVVGLTAVGRATIAALALNRDRAIHIRAADRVVDRHPPSGDPVQGAAL
jgi:hypothetical protein